MFLDQSNYNFIEFSKFFCLYVENFSDNKMQSHNYMRVNWGGHFLKIEKL